MKILTILMLFCISFTAPSRAQEMASQIHKTPFATPDVLRAHYTETRYIESLSQPLRSTGTFVYMKKGGLLWDMRTPFDMQTIITEKGLTQWVDGQKQPQSDATQAAMRPILGNISAIFQGDLEEINKHFNISEDKTDKKWVLKLIPRSETIKPYVQSITVRGEDYIQEITITFTQKKYTIVTYEKPQIGIAHITEKERALFEEQQ